MEPTAETYVDQLIEPVEGEKPFAEEIDSKKGLARYGPGALGIEYRYYDTKASGDVEGSLKEQGIGVFLRQDTPNFGRIDLRAVATDQTQDPGVDQGSGTGFRLIQTDFALNENWLMDNLVGNFLAATPRLIAQSYRLRLPAPVIEGLSSRLTRGNTHIAATTGKLGVERGRTFLVFDEKRRTGDIAGVAATHRFNNQWSAGLQAWNVTDATVDGTMSDHTSLAGVAQYRNPAASQLGQLHFLHNDDGQLGLWADGELRPGRWQHNFGVFRLDPNLQWVDNISNVNNDRQGGYWTGTYRRFRLRLGFGADYYETNLDDNPKLVGRKVANSFANVSYQLSQRTNVSGSVSFVSQRQGAGLSGPDSDTENLRTTLSHRFGVGTSFWTVGLDRRNGGLNPGKRRELIWDHEWKVPTTDRLRTGIQYERDEQQLGTFTQTTLRVLANRDFDNGRVGLNGGATVGVAGGGMNEDGRSSNINFSIDWRFSRNWKIRSELTWNHNVTELAGGQEIRVTQRTVFFSLRYEKNWGQPQARLGRSSGAYGNGRISGTVFLDENRNGIQEPDEPGVPNVTVYLDRGYTIETDAKGQYEFWPVPAGEHRLIVTLDNVPLPWGLDDEAPRTLEIGARETERLDFPLTEQNR
ncbi:MAG: SdrD B-like domain-containing protein [Acidiferrobacterales bacterium]